jgi:hypothetical protein
MKRDSVIDTGRREFTLAAMLAMLSGVTITISGCGGSSSSSPTPQATTPPAGDKTATISANHGHVAVITSAKLTAGNALVLDIQGSATHNHTVELSAAEVVQIRDGARVAKESSATDHRHTVTFN